MKNGCVNVIHWTNRMAFDLFLSLSKLSDTTENQAQLMRRKKKARNRKKRKEDR